MNDARKRRKPREYAQKIIILTKFAEMNSIFNQFNVVYNDVDVKLKKDLRRFINTTFLNDYFQKLNDFKNIWWNLIKKKK